MAAQPGCATRADETALSMSPAPEMGTIRTVSPDGMEDTADKTRAITTKDDKSLPML